MTGSIHKNNIVIVDEHTIERKTTVGDFWTKNNKVGKFSSIFYIPPDDDEFEFKIIVKC